MHGLPGQSIRRFRAEWRVIDMVPHPLPRRRNPAAIRRLSSSATALVSYRRPAATVGWPWGPPIVLLCLGLLVRSDSAGRHEQLMFLAALFTLSLRVSGCWAARAMLQLAAALLRGVGLPPRGGRVSGIGRAPRDWGKSSRCGLRNAFFGVSQSGHGLQVGFRWSARARRDCRGNLRSAVREEPMTRRCGSVWATFGRSRRVSPRRTLLRAADELAPGNPAAPFSSVGRWRSGARGRRALGSKSCPRTGRRELAPAVGIAVAREVHPYLARRQAERFGHPIVRILPPDTLRTLARRVRLIASLRRGSRSERNAKGRC